MQTDPKLHIAGLMKHLTINFSTTWGDRHKPCRNHSLTHSCFSLRSLWLCSVTFCVFRVFVVWSSVPVHGWQWKVSFLKWPIMFDGYVKVDVLVKTLDLRTCSAVQSNGKSVSFVLHYLRVASLLLPSSFSCECLLDDQYDLCPLQQPVVADHTPHRPDTPTSIASLEVLSSCRLFF